MLVSAMAKDSFRRFSKLEGCQHIANEYAIETILKICRDFKIKSILEVGLGIGAIVDTVQIYYNTQTLMLLANCRMVCWRFVRLINLIFIVCL